MSQESLLHNDGPAHIHSHRALIGFDSHGIPTIVAKSDHDDDSDPNAFIRDYMNAVNEYKKTFPSKQDVVAQTPDPAVREMLVRTEQLGIDTTFDRFDRMIWDDAGADGTVYVICQITDSNGDQVLTRKAKFVYSSVSSSKPTISVQPRDASSDAEGFATYTVQINGGKAPYTYDWYVDVSGYVELAGTDTTSNTFDTISLSTDFYPTYTSTVQVYCIISDAYGQSVTTNKVSMKP